MNKIIGFSLFCMFILISCTSQSKEPVATSFFDVSTSVKNYPAAANQGRSSESDGFLGLVKIYVEHGFEDVKGTRGIYVAQGTGSIIVRDGRWFVITAKHMAVPNPDLKSIVVPSDDSKKKVKTISFKQMSKIASSVVVGYTSVEPSIIWFPVDENVDIAVLEISAETAPSVVYRAFNYKVDCSYPVTDPITLGHDVEVWGYPARQSPQMQKLNVSDVASGYFVLNKSLEPGYSGGLVLVGKGNAEKIASGMITRADKESNQSIALSWATVNMILDAVVKNDASIQKVALDETIQYKGVSFQFVAYALSSHP